MRMGEALRVCVGEGWEGGDGVPPRERPRMSSWDFSSLGQQFSDGSIPGLL